MKEKRTKRHTAWRTALRRARDGIARMPAAILAHSVDRRFLHLSKTQSVTWRIACSLVVLAASALFIYQNIPDGWDALWPRLLLPSNLITLAEGSLALAIGDAFLGCGWYLLLRAMIREPLPFGSLLRDYATSHFLRYLGGFWGSTGLRHASMRRNHRVANSTLLSAAVVEISLLLGISLLLALPALINVATGTWHLGAEVGAHAAKLTVPILLLAAVGLAVACRSVRGPGFAAAGLAYGMFVAINSGVFIVLFAQDGHSWLGNAATCNLSWVIGQLTPGAVQGLGIREAVIMSLLHVKHSGAAVLFAALNFRLMLIGGDMLFFLAARLPLLLGLSRQRGQPATLGAERSKI